VLISCVVKSDNVYVCYNGMYYDVDIDLSNIILLIKQNNKCMSLYHFTCIHILEVNIHKGANSSTIVVEKISCEYSVCC